ELLVVVECALGYSDPVRHVADRQQSGGPVGWLRVARRARVGCGGGHVGCPTHLDCASGSSPIGGRAGRGGALADWSASSARCGSGTSGFGKIVMRGATVAAPFAVTPEPLPTVAPAALSTTPPGPPSSIAPAALAIGPPA